MEPARHLRRRHSLGLAIVVSDPRQDRCGVVALSHDRRTLDDRSAGGVLARQARYDSSDAVVVDHRRA
jgi:hypothetical protein